MILDSAIDRGFSFVELILVIVVLSIAATSLVPLFGQITGSLVFTRDTGAATELAQECAEHLLAARRESGFDLGGLTDCSALALFNGNGPAAVFITDPYSGDGCPTSASCKLIRVTATYSSSSSQIQFMLVDY